MKISRREPIKAWLVMEALREETRQKIIELLLEKGEMSLTEIQGFVGKTLPTLLFHMNALERAGLVSWRSAKRGKKTTKVYYIKSKILNLEIDIDTFSRIGDLKRVEGLVFEMIEKILASGNKFDKELPIAKISRLMEVDYNTALVMRDYIVNFEDEIVKYLYEKFKDKMIDLKDPLEIAEKFNISLYWAARLVKYT